MPVSSKDEKLINALLYAIEDFPDIGKTRLMKFVLFADVIIYHELGDTLLADKYKRMDWGPVPDEAFYLTSFTNKYFDVEEVPLTPEKKRFVFPLKVHSNRDLFSEREKEVFDKILRLFRKMSAEEISDFTHRFSFWKNLGENEEIPLDVLNLDDYEYFNFITLLAYDDAMELSGDALYKPSEIEIDC